MNLEKEKPLSSKDIFINEVMLKAAQRKMPVTRKEVEACIDFYMKTGAYLNIDLILNTLNLTNSSNSQ